MITKEQALTCDGFHYGTCMRIIGPRGRALDGLYQGGKWTKRGESETLGWMKGKR